MRSGACVWLLGPWAIVVAALATAAGQQMTVSTPFHSVGDSYFENMGVGWGIRGKGFDLRFGGPTLAAPQFGRFNPGAGANLGFGFRNGGPRGFLNANWSQGWQGSCVSQVPVLTVTDGVPGYMAVGTMSPFVVGYVPVVGGYPTIPAVFAMPPMPVVPPASSGVGADAIRQALRQSAARQGAALAEDDGPAMPAAPPVPAVAPQPAKAAAPGATGGLPPSVDATRPGNLPAAGTASAGRLALAQESTAGRPAPSVQEAKRLWAAEQASQHAEARVWFERGLSAEQAGNLGAAKAYYHMAARRADDALKREILQRVEAIEEPPRGTVF